MLELRRLAFKGLRNQRVASRIFQQAKSKKAKAAAEGVVGQRAAAALPAELVNMHALVCVCVHMSWYTQTHTHNTC